MLIAFILTEGDYDPVCLPCGETVCRSHSEDICSENCPFDKSIRLWEVTTGNYLKTLEGHTRCVTSVHIDGRGLLASGSADRSIRLWEVTTGNCLKTLEGHTHCVTSVHFDGRGLLASGSADRSIRLWE